MRYMRCHTSLSTPHNSLYTTHFPPHHTLPSPHHTIPSTPHTSLHTTYFPLYHTLPSTPHTSLHTTHFPLHHTLHSRSPYYLISHTMYTLRPHTTRTQPRNAHYRPGYDVAYAMVHDVQATYN